MPVQEHIAIRCPQGTVALQYDDGLDAWVGVTVTVLAPLRVYGLARGHSFARLLQPGTTTTIAFSPRVNLVTTPRGSRDASTQFALGAGSA